MNGKKLLSIALSTLLTLSLAAPALAADLPDGWTPADGARVSGPWYAEAVDYVQDKGYMVGTDQGFEPEAAISAAQILQTLFNREGKPDAAGTEQPWYADAVAWAEVAGYQTATIADLEADADRILIARILHWYGLTLKEIPATGTTEVSTLADYASIYKTDYPYIGYCMNTGLMVGNQDNEWAPSKTLTRAEFATILMRLDQVDPVETKLSLADYLAQGGQEWFLTGKTAYTIQGMLVSKDTPYENVLEGNSGVVTDDGVTVLLKGTVDELWPSKLEKVMKTYTKADGSELTAKDFEPKDTYIDLKTKAQPGTNFAMFIPADIQVVVETAWGDVLTANRPGVEHGKGDYLVSTVKDGQPDLSDVWVLNGAVFPNTYDLTNAPAKYHVAVLVPNPTDGSYFEAGVNGAKALADTAVDVVAMGSIPVGEKMPTAEEELEFYAHFFTEAAESGKYDLILTGGAECTPAMVEAAKAYPDQKFMSFDLQHLDGTVLEKDSYPNVYGVVYKNQDLGYLAGYIACAVTTSDMPGANADKKIGVLIGMDAPGMNDYVGSVCQVAKEQGVTVYVDYVGDFAPSAMPTAAEKAKAMYDDGVDVIWQVAGGAGKGVFTAAKEAGRYALGVDCDQTLTVSDPDEAATIVTSFYANSPAVIADAWEALLAGNFPGGTYPTVGLAEGYVGFADNEQFEAMTSQALRDAVAELFETMAKGETQVFQASADAEAWAQLKADVAP